MATTNQPGQPISGLPFADSVSPTDALLGIITKAGGTGANQVSILVLAQAISAATGLDDAVEAAQTSAASAAAKAEAAGSAASDALLASRGSANGVAALSGNKRLVLGGVEVLGASQDGHLLITVDLPTADPEISGALWNNGQYVMISAG
ncbi:hypothetical protein [Gluconobacter japonicus]|uniref:hypothetical protein n=1 Tax=Gluconobacter japonicus TaxID=376620 RepID=UPI000780C667|nr:hypothetical protein [Gluconobacter japonicus]